MISIKQIMDGEHKRLMGMLLELEKLKGNDDIADIFRQFKWDLEKHFFLEEKAIFGIYGSITGQDVSDIFELVEEHGMIIDIVKGIGQTIENGREVSTSLLREILEKHSDFEDNSFYPKLDEELSEEQKKEMAERAKEILA